MGRIFWVSHRCCYCDSVSASNWCQSTINIELFNVCQGIDAFLRGNAIDIVVLRGLVNVSTDQIILNGWNCWDRIGAKSIAKYCEVLWLTIHKIDCAWECTCTINIGLCFTYSTHIISRRVVINDCYYAVVCISTINVTEHSVITCRPASSKRVLAINLIEDCLQRLCRDATSRVSRLCIFNKSCTASGAIAS